MIPPLTALAIAAGLVLVTDLAVTYLRKRLRRASASPGPPPTEAEAEGRPDEGVADESE